MPPPENPDLAAIVEALIFASPEPITTASLVRAIRSAAAGTTDSAGEGGGLVADDSDADASESGLDADDESVAESLLESSELSPLSVRDEPRGENRGRGLRGVTESHVAEAIDQLIAHYAESGRAFTLEERLSGWRIFTRPEFAAWVRGIFPERRPQRLSQPALETLAIIAYRQPITKAAIEAVRGVTIDGPLQRLLDMNIIRIAGRAELPGRPLLYETTDLFFDHFGIKSVDDLPNAAELRRVALPEAGHSKSDEPEAEQPELPISGEAGAPPAANPLSEPASS